MSGLEGHLKTRACAKDEIIGTVSADENKRALAYFYFILFSSWFIR
jgi:hypothetical protein